MKERHKPIFHGYRNIVAPGQSFLSDRFLEHTANESLYVLPKKKKNFYKESVVHPFARV